MTSGFCCGAFPWRVGLMIKKLCCLNLSLSVLAFFFSLMATTPSSRNSFHLAAAHRLIYVCFSSSLPSNLLISTLCPILPSLFFPSFSTFHHPTHQAYVNILQPIFEAPLHPLFPLPHLPLSTSLSSFSSPPPPPRPLPLSISLPRISDRSPSSAGPLPTCSPVPTLIPASASTVPDQPPFSSPFFYSAPLPSSQSPTATLQSTNTQTQSSSSSSGDGSLFRQLGSQAAQPDETGRVWPYVDFSQFYCLWGSDHSDGQSTQGGHGPQ